MKLIKCDDTARAYAECPWATVIVKTERGCLCFLDFGVYNEWKANNK